MSSVRFQSARLAVVLTVALAAGCGAGDRKPVYSARGKVTDVRGQPVPGATVIFHPAGGGGDGHKPAGTTDKDGNFVLTTYTHQDGAPAGEYAVTVEWRDLPKRPTDEPPDKLKGKFRDPKTSPFKATVKAGANELPPITLP